MYLECFVLMYLVAGGNLPGVYLGNPTELCVAREGVTCRFFEWPDGEQLFPLIQYFFPDISLFSFFYNLYIWIQYFFPHLSLFYFSIS